MTDNIIHIVTKPAEHTACKWNGTDRSMMLIKSIVPANCIITHHAGYLLIWGTITIWLNEYVVVWNTGEIEGYSEKAFYETFDIIEK